MPHLESVFSAAQTAIRMGNTLLCLARLFYALLIKLTNRCFTCSLLRLRFLQWNSILPNHSNLPHSWACLLLTLYSLALSLSLPHTQVETPVSPVYLACVSPCCFPQQLTPRRTGDTGTDCHTTTPQSMTRGQSQVSDAI